jgi:hypothetical protein
MESNILRQDDSDAGSSSIGNKRIDGKKLAKKGWRKATESDFKGEETVTETKSKALVGFSYVRVQGKSNTDDLFAERMKLHEAEIKEFLAKHSEIRIER